MLTDVQEKPHSTFVVFGTGLGVLALTAALGWAILSLPEEPPGLYSHVHSRLPESGVESLVTAVLLNFRAYDTMLEIAVLFVAVLGLRAIRLGSEEPLPESAWISKVLMEFVRFLAPVMVLLAGYLLWVGSKYPGGAFQSGAVLGAVGILLEITERLRAGSIRVLVEKTALAAGVLVFAGIGLYCMFWGGNFLEYPAGQAKGLILLVETAGAISIGATLMVLFAGRSLADVNDAAIGSANE